MKRREFLLLLISLLQFFWLFKTRNKDYLAVKDSRSKDKTTKEKNELNDYYHYI